MTSCYGNLKCVPFNGKEKDYESGFHYYGARYYWGELLTGWLSVDPMADKYPQISSYNYCIWNPIRIIDPDGRDGWDKIAGICIGFVTNVVPGTSRLRDIYSPTNMADYNSSLRAADNTTMVVGGLMATVGAMGAIAGSSLVSGGAAIAATGIGAPEGAAVAATGVAVDATSAIMGAGGAIMTAQAASNSSQGYNRGGDKTAKSSATTIQSKTQWKSKGKDNAHIDVENPNPNHRKGCIHYQEGNRKYFHNTKTKMFEGAPRSVNKRLQSDKKMQKAVKNGLKYLDL